MPPGHARADESHVAQAPRFRHKLGGLGTATPMRPEERGVSACAEGEGRNRLTFSGVLLSLCQVF